MVVFTAPGGFHTPNPHNKSRKRHRGPSAGKERKPVAGQNDLFTTVSALLAPQNRARILRFTSRPSRNPVRSPTPTTSTPWNERAACTRGSLALTSSLWPLLTWLPDTGVCRRGGGSSAAGSSAAGWSNLVCASLGLARSIDRWTDPRKIGW